MNGDEGKQAGSAAEAPALRSLAPENGARWGWCLYWGQKVLRQLPR